MRNFNYSDLKKRTWDNETLQLVAQIHEYKGKQEAYIAQKPVTLERLVEIAKVQSTEASNKIEGIITTNTRIQQLCAEKTTPRNRDEEEISGYRDVLKVIHENYEYIPITANYILQLHGMLYRYSGRSIGGQFKNVQNFISETGSDGKLFIIFTPLSPIETPDAVNSICENYNKVIDDGTIDPLLLIPVFIKDFLCIHPFNDGNGRMSRLLTTLLLYRSGYMVSRFISLEAKIERNKDVYYDFLKITSERWHEADDNPIPFAKYLLGIVLSAYRDLNERISLVENKTFNKLSALKIVHCAIQTRIGKFTKHELLELCPSIGKTSIENALKTLLKDGSITRHGNGKNTFYTRN